MRLRFWKKPAPGMSCNELVELVTDYLEMRLPPADLRRFEAHLEECDACATYVEQIRATVAVVGTLTEESLPAGAADALLAEFRDWQRAQG
jgi:anti-sigma factor RsiW